jgi:hypothetical protein
LKASIARAAPAVKGCAAAEQSGNRLSAKIMASKIMAGKIAAIQ